jgi:hypothetical protein
VQLLDLLPQGSAAVGGATRQAAPDRLRKRHGTYVFNKHAIEHRFCRICGIHPFAEDAASEGEPSAYVNIRCLEDIDLASVPVIDFDGRSL